MEDKEIQNNTENSTAPTEDAIKEEIESLKQQVEQQKANALAKLIAERDALQKEVESYNFAGASTTTDNLKNSTTTNEVSEKTDIEKIEAKFREIDYALENYPIGHEKRRPFALNETYNGVDLLNAYGRYTKGEKVSEIFKSPFSG